MAGVVAEGTKSHAAKPEAGPAPLAGLVVLDFSTLLPGPMATAMLLGHGAHVIKIERPGGEDMRRFPPVGNGTSAPYHALNKGKQVIEIDLKSASARREVMALVANADILVEQFRPGVMQRLGFCFEALHRINPRLIYASITGYGQSGPRAQEAGHDINYQARSGLLGLSLDATVHNPLPPALIADIAGGAMAAVTQVLLALRQRDQDGHGRHLDISMSGGLKAFLWYQQAIRDAGAFSTGSGQGVLTGGSPRYGLYRTADGRFLAVGALEEKFWAVFCDTIGLAEQLRPADADASIVTTAVSLLVAAHPASFWHGVFEPLDCCCTLVATYEEACADPHFG